MRKTIELMKSVGIEVEFLELEKNGYYDPEFKILFINQNLSEKERKKTIMHEVGHGILHDELFSLYKMPIPHSKMEFEANKFMVKNLLIDYIDLYSLSAEQIDYMKFMDHYAIDYVYEEYIKSLLVNIQTTTESKIV